MTQQQHIRYLSIIGFLVLLVMVGFLCMSAVQHRVTSRLDDMKISFNRPAGQDGFINESHIVRLIKNTFGDDLSDRAVDETDLGLIEDVLKEDTYIGKANAYINGANTLVIDIQERMPKYRVMQDGADSYYVDDHNKILPIHNRYVVRVPVVTVDRNLNELSAELREKLVGLVDGVTKDEFLNALIEQVHIDNHGGIYLIPKIGKEKLLFGGLEDIPDKLYKIKQFYKKGLTTKGWNTYDKIDLRFKDQVIGTIKE